MNYIEEAINSELLSDQLFNDSILEQMDIERDFMLACLENNIILEAETPESDKKGNWLKIIIENIKRIFTKFIEKAKDLFKNDEKWISDNIPKLKDLDFNGLKVDIIPYWKIDSREITSVLSSLQKEVNNIKYGDARLKDLQDREKVENSGQFKKYVRKNGNFADGIKSYFKTGENNEPKPVKLENDQLKIICVNQMSRYVNEYNSTLLPSLKSSYDNFNNMLNKIEKEISRNKPVGESFCVIENAYYTDTELTLCMNYNTLFEADGANTTQPKSNEQKKPENKDTVDKSSLNKVEDTSKNSNNNSNNNDNTNNNTNKDGNTQYYTYLKHVVQLNQLAIAAALTACEERYRAYMSVLRGVVAARGSKK